MIYDNLSVSPAGHLTFADCDTTELAQTYGTPLQVLDENRIRNRCREYKKAMADYLPAGSRPLYASKALSIKRIYEIMKEEGMGVDVVSSGELYTAARAGFPMEHAYFHSNNKTDADIAFAMDKGVGYFVVDNAEELYAIENEAKSQLNEQKEKENFYKKAEISGTTLVKYTGEEETVSIPEGITTIKNSAF